MRDSYRRACRIEALGVNKARLRQCMGRNISDTRTQFEGLLIPGFLLWTGDVPLVGVERYRKLGTAVRLPAWANERLRSAGDGSSR